MKNLLIILLKVIVVIAAGLLIVHLWPMAIIPMLGAFGLMLGLMGLFLASTIAVGTVGLSVLTALAAVAAVLLAVLSPLWIPAILILGILWLVKRLGGMGRRSAGA